jgi:hypothetical protein
MLIGLLCSLTGLFQNLFLYSGFMPHIYWGTDGTEISVQVEFALPEAATQVRISRKKKTIL